MSKDGHLAIEMAKAQIKFYLVAPIETRKEVLNGAQNSNAWHGGILPGIPEVIGPNYAVLSLAHFTIY
ncbi:hypothetical protein PGT21_012456 [Puccinia graminis f. sp. tritici]|uniref:Uncharacterized protein n=1 Tax=Puccinia graminis f. sp. tritici TaxID=56615 RepID=A0A5B0MNM7_PUCGR|nr:hypothetical protein PGT21_012456 [Puccinia graminis f. sp. tritici]